VRRLKIGGYFPRPDAGPLLMALAMRQLSTSTSPRPSDRGLQQQRE